MIENARLLEILQPFGTVEDISDSATSQRPVLEDGVLWLPCGERRRLRVPVDALPGPAAQLLELCLQAFNGEAAGRWREEVVGWLAGEQEMTVEQLSHALTKIGWRGERAAVVAIELLKEAGEEQITDSLALLSELIAQGEPEDEDTPAPLIVRAGASTIHMLMPYEWIDGDQQVGLTAVLSTLEAELYVPAIAGVSAVKALRELPSARAEAQFALASGRLYRSGQSVHRYDQLGIARLLYGLPSDVRDDFLTEILPQSVLESLSPELRETIYAFLEHGQQVADTARSLYIHRNTLLYRLDRVTELTGYDIRKPLQGWTLWVALTLSRSL